MPPPNVDGSGAPYFGSAPPGLDGAGMARLRQLTMALDPDFHWCAEEALQLWMASPGALGPFLSHFMTEFSGWAIENGLESGQVRISLLRSLTSVVGQFERDGDFATLMHHAATPGGLTEAAMAQLDALEFPKIVRAYKDALLSRSASFAERFNSDATTKR